MAFVHEGVLTKRYFGSPTAQRPRGPAHDLPRARKCIVESGAAARPLLGCSLTGWQDMVNATGMDRTEQAALLDRLRATAHEGVEKVAAALGLNMPCW